MKVLYLIINVMGLLFFLMDDIYELSIQRKEVEVPICSEFSEHIKNNGLKIWHILLVTIFPAILIYPIVAKILIAIGSTIGHKIYNIFNFTIYKKKEDNTFKK